MKPVFIIAEIGVNHNGDMEIAKSLIDKAATAGVDAVKSQYYHADDLVTRSAPKAAYQKEGTVGDEQFSMLKKLELSLDDYKSLAAFASDKNIQFFSTPFDKKSVQELYELDVPFFKVPSGEITNLPYLIDIARTQKPVLLSTGMSTLQEIGAAVQALHKNGALNITLLHCNTQYPTPYEDANLLAIQTLKREFGLPVGYSDHTTGIDAAIAAVALGAEVLEKHFTLSKGMDGPDHRASIEPEELATMVTSIRNIEKALGDGVKRVMPSEQENIAVVRKSIVAAKDIKKGEVFTEENITTKRPGTGISPMMWFEVVGKTASRNYLADELIGIIPNYV